MKGSESTEINKSRQKSPNLNTGQHFSAKVGASRQKSTLFNSSRSSVHGMQADYQRPTHVLEHKGLWRRCACFYRQVLIFQREGMWRLLLQMWHKCATASSSTFLDSSTV